MSSLKKKFAQANLGFSVGSCRQTQVPSASLSKKLNVSPYFSQQFKLYVRHIKNNWPTRPNTCSLLFFYLCSCYPHMLPFKLPSGLPRFLWPYTVAELFLCLNYLKTLNYFIFLPKKNSISSHQHACTNPVPDY